MLYSRTPTKFLIYPTIITFSDRVTNHNLSIYRLPCLWSKEERGVKESKGGWTSVAYKEYLLMFLKFRNCFTKRPIGIACTDLCMRQVKFSTPPRLC